MSSCKKPVMRVWYGCTISLFLRWDHHSLLNCMFQTKNIYPTENGLHPPRRLILSCLSLLRLQFTALPVCLYNLTAHRAVRTQQDIYSLVLEQYICILNCTMYFHMFLNCIQATVCNMLLFCNFYMLINIYIIQNYTILCTCLPVLSGL